MRDLKLIMPEDKSTPWTLDFDIIDGYPQFVAYEQNTQDQRAAVAAYTLRGSIPGKPSLGINWQGLYDNDQETLVALDNEIQQAIQKYAAVQDGPGAHYVPIYMHDGENIQLSIYQG